jgi:hypothetical protein
VTCTVDGCEKAADSPHDECYRHRIMSVGITLRGGAIVGNNGFHRTKSEWLQENMGVSYEKELVGRKDIDKVG